MAFFLAVGYDYFSNDPEKLKDYYQILRVSRQAHEVDIKRAYRKLAVVFHPDKNPSEEASALFQEINEAHEILIDKDKRAQYDLLLQGTPATAPPSGAKWHRDPAYRRQHQPGYKRPAPRPPEHLLMMAHFLKYLRTICLIGIGWCAFLLFDLVLPHRIIKETVLPESSRLYGWQFDHMPYVVVTQQGHQFPVSREGADFFPVGSVIEINTSRILNLLVKVVSEKKEHTIYGLDSVYQNFLFAPIMLFIFSLFGLTLRNGIEFRFSFGIAICMGLFFNLIFLIFSIV